MNKLKVDLNMYYLLMKDIVMDDLMTILLLQCTIMAEERERERDLYPTVASETKKV